MLKPSNFLYNIYKKELTLRPEIKILLTGYFFISRFYPEYSNLQFFYDINIKIINIKTWDNLVSVIPVAPALALSSFPNRMGVARLPSALLKFHQGAENFSKIWNRC
jgi:hypothetical protein